MRVPLGQLSVRSDSYPNGGAVTRLVEAPGTKVCLGQIQRTSSALGPLHCFRLDRVSRPVLRPACGRSHRKRAQRASRLLPKLSRLEAALECLNVPRYVKFAVITGYPRDVSATS